MDPRQPDLADTYVLDAWRLRQQNALPASPRPPAASPRASTRSTAAALTELALIYEQTGMPDRARVLYERILARDPQPSRDRPPRRAQSTRHPTTVAGTIK